MKMQSIDDLLYTGLTYVHNFEQQIGSEAPKMAQASSNPELKQTFEQTESKSQEYAQRVQQAFAKLGKEPKSNDNPIAKAMIDEVENMIANTDPSPVRDAALIVAANQQQLYRVASYGSLKTYAELIGKGDAVAELQQNLEDSKGGDAKLTKIAETQVNQQAVQGQKAAA
jgi:ferritin-like metal-binding protein YciE